MMVSLSLASPADLRWAQAQVMAHHYLHTPVDARCSPVAYIVRLAKHRLSHTEGSFFMESLSQNEFDTKTWYLGKVCPKGHRWNSTEHSLRYRSSMSCIECHKARIRGPLSHATARDRFWRKVDRSGGDEQCWTWKGATSGGYGVITLNKKRIRTHRFSWEIINGTIPQELVICHRCDNPLCVNPSHLFLGTVADNNADRDAKGRLSKAESGYHRKRVREGIHAWLQLHPLGRPRGEQNGSAKVNNCHILEIRASYAKGNITYRQLAEQYGVSKTTIGDILRGKIWRHVGGDES